MDLCLAGKRAIVTGASRGIGLAVAKGLHREGVVVLLAARHRGDLEDARARFEQGGPPVHIGTVDTTDDEAVRHLVADANEQLGGISILVNAAATPADPAASTALHDLVDDDLRQEVESKVLGYLRTARAVAPQMIDAGWGRIINVSGLAARSTGSVFGSIRNVAVAAMTKNLADELGPSGVNVTAVHPGMTVTERTAGVVARLADSSRISPEQAMQRLASSVTIGRLVTAMEVADVVTFLASPRSVAINGDAIAVGGGTPGTIHY